MDKPVPAPPPERYFRQTNFFVALLVIFGMTLCHFGCRNPTAVPDQYLGPVGVVYRYLSYGEPRHICWIYHAALALHVAEAALTVRLTWSKGISDPRTRFKWFVQTLLCGVFSLRYLLAYQPPKVD